ncbi:hypothetical protein Acr_00g0064040 [Actinidia rufa]|uniref:Uncharacterized protein n=1 Tax=Actinidia rufa TaxID=165716 RepID=A0A7J0DPE6_9ERIC|nr:hypothetical protein Acr_00g0064040 [Actinidia rufa]
MREMQLVEEEQKVLEDVGMTLKTNVIEDLIRYDLDKPNSDYFFLIGSNLRERKRTELIKFLIVREPDELDVKLHTKLLGIDPDFIKDELNVIPEARPVKEVYN